MQAQQRLELLDRVAGVFRFVALPQKSEQHVKTVPQVPEVRRRFLFLRAGANEKQNITILFVINVYRHNRSSNSAQVVSSQSTTHLQILLDQVEHYGRYLIDDDVEYALEILLVQFVAQRAQVFVQILH